ncbi:hypothetical protein [Crocosphaera sp.]|uniref:hypothetical protein n=1 Tax=Crocosphaera sp. TaxID=2729996 RepID=UPI0026047697|nr:hypothetical protein [Crocosphaera sp.]MDJ0581251.1 hypothetical protein [Crocosphaera sp.]
MNNNLLNLQQEAINENTSPKRLEELANIPEVAHLVAQNVNSSPKTLTQLAENSSENILKALVVHPSTATKILIKLGDKFPEELVKNPIVISLEQLATDSVDYVSYTTRNQLKYRKDNSYE